MSRKRRWWWVGICWAGLLTSGCHSLGGKTPPAETRVEAKAAPRTPSRLDLPADESAKLCLATSETLQKGGQLREAILLLEKARLDNPRLNVSHRLAILYDLQGEFLKSQAEYKRALEAKPNDPDLHNDLGYSHYCRGRWDEAETHLRKAIAAQPKHPRAWMNLGLTLAQQGKYAESLAAFEKTVTPAQAKCNLAFILTTQGKREEAKQAYREALSLEPDLHIARMALDKLEQAPAARRESKAPPKTATSRAGRPLPAKSAEVGRAHAADPLDEPVIISVAAELAAETPLVRRRAPASDLLTLATRMPPRTSAAQAMEEATYGYVMFSDDLPEALTTASR